MVRINFTFFTLQLRSERVVSGMSAAIKRDGVLTVSLFLFRQRWAMIAHIPISFARIVLDSSDSKYSRVHDGKKFVIEAT